MKDSKTVQHFCNCFGKQYGCKHQVVYNNKLEHKYTLTPLDPSLIYVGLIQAKAYLSRFITATCLYYMYYTQLFVQHTQYFYCFATMVFKTIQYHDILGHWTNVFNVYTLKTLKYNNFSNIYPIKTRQNPSES